LKYDTVRRLLKVKEHDVDILLKELNDAARDAYENRTPIDSGHKWVWGVWRRWYKHESGEVNRSIHQEDRFVPDTEQRPNTGIVPPLTESATPTTEQATPETETAIRGKGVTREGGSSGEKRSEFPPRIKLSLSDGTYRIWKLDNPERGYYKNSYNPLSRRIQGPTMDIYTKI
jgi:hypothetical protein